MDTPPDLNHPPRTARAADHPCEVYQYHAPQPVRTEYHHTKPVYLQNRLYGHIVYGADLWVCGNCHDAIHEWLYYLMGEQRRPNPEPGWKAKRVAEATHEWFLSEVLRMSK